MSERHRESYRSKPRVVGHLGIDVLYYNGTECDRFFGGALFHFACASASAGLQIELISSCRLKKWRDPVAVWNQWGHGTQHIKDCDSDTHFHCYLDQYGRFDDDAHWVENIPEVPGDEDLRAMGGPLHICTMSIADARKIKEIAAPTKLSIQTHVSILRQDIAGFLELCDGASTVFLSLIEAKVIMEKLDITSVEKLSELLSPVVFITNERSACLVADGRRHDVIAPNVIVSDGVGAGDAFAGAAFAILALTDDPHAALIMGTYVASAQVTGHLSRFTYQNLASRWSSVQD